MQNGMVAIVDSADYELVSKHFWHTRQRCQTWYATTSLNNTTVLMHRLITGVRKGQQLDHKNRNGLDNRRENLRLASTRQQSWNKTSKRLMTGRRRGVTRATKCGRTNVWVARINLPEGKTYLGMFPTEDDAARIYDAAARHHFGEFAVLNFPDEIIPYTPRVSKVRPPSSGYVGVEKRGKKWLASINTPERRVRLGLFDTAEAASAAYRAALIRKGSGAAATQ